MDDNLIAHIWMSGDKIQYATERGYYAILSSCWYLNRISSTSEWIDYYKCDPQVASITTLE